MDPTSSVGETRQLNPGLLMKKPMNVKVRDRKEELRLGKM
jgi:hypothetical protein